MFELDILLIVYHDAEFSNTVQGMAVYLAQYTGGSTKAPWTAKQVVDPIRIWIESWFKPASKVSSRADIQYLFRKGAKQSIKERHELMPNPMNQPVNCSDFVTSDFVKLSLDPYTIRFLQLDVKDKNLQGYIDLTIEHPNDFAEVQKATLMTKIVDDSNVECEGILCTRNNINFSGLLTSEDDQVKASRYLRIYLYVHVRRIIDLLSERGYVITDGNLERHLQFWRVSRDEIQIRLGKSIYNEFFFTNSVKRSLATKRIFRSCISVR